MKDMKRNKDNRENSKNVLDSFIIIDGAIDLSIQEEYFRFSETIDFDNVDYEGVLTESDKLFYEDTPVELKKRILILLAHLGSPESCRTLEKYLKISERNLKDWALLSLKECRTFLESVLLQEEGGFISTGLGGKDNKLRYYFIVGSKDGLPFSETHRNTLKRGFETISLKYKSEIEEINCEATYAMIGILIPMDVAVGEVIEEGISECNKMSEFLFPDYYVTNVKKPTLKEISKYLEEIGYEEK
ncbi:MAG: hypothetical protein ABII96_01740 [Candidatus Zixiibacteriota bacterium]